jgi:MoaA/NifB/PqqE/SkfB family radical SAM enzyme
MKLEEKVKINNFIISNLLKIAFSVSHTPLFKKILFPLVEKGIRNSIDRLPGPVALPGVKEDKFYMARAMIYSGLRVGSSSKFANTIVNKAILSDLRAKKETEFRAEFGFDPPGFMTISPAKRCNLRCRGCYANSASEKDQLDYSILSRVIKDMHDLWGARFVVISGGEPMMYRWNGKGIMDIYREHPDSLFLMYTNGTLINDKIAHTMYELGNITPAISVEGMRELTEQRRGKGIFEKITQAMKILKRHRVTYGISITATRYNVEEIMSDKFIDYYFNELNAAYGWIFHYMPIGRDVDPDLIPTPEQRVWLWKKSWDIVIDRKIMLVDFWNHGPVSDGCISAGRPGGYFYLDWQGNVYPCVFFPYANANIGKIYKQGRNLNDIINLPLHCQIRNWQFKYWREGDLLRPCPIRDHYKMAKKFVIESNALPGDEGAEKIISDPEYEKKMDEYDASLKEKTSRIWEEVYIQGNGSRKHIKVT